MKVTKKHIDTLVTIETTDSSTGKQIKRTGFVTSIGLHGGRWLFFFRAYNPEKEVFIPDLSGLYTRDAWEVLS